MSIEPISKFMNRVKTASQGRSKDVRLSLEEAQELMGAIGELMVSKISELEENAKPAEKLEIKVDGGNF